jgi:hypothetical protein
MPLPLNTSVSYFARTNFRNQGTLVGIKQADRLSHMYVIGKTGTGKSTLLETLAFQDIAQGRGMMLIDPHGDLAERIMGGIPPHRRHDVIYFNVPDPNQPYGYNPLKHVREDKISLAASGLLEAFKKMWPDAWGVRMEHVLRNALLALLEQPNVTLLDVLRLLDDKTYRSAIVDRLANDQVRRFWRDEYDHYPPRLKAEAIAPIQNKIGAYLADPTLRRILTSPEKPIHLRRLMDEGAYSSSISRVAKSARTPHHSSARFWSPPQRSPRSAAPRFRKPTGAPSSSISTNSRPSRPEASPR